MLGLLRFSLLVLLSCNAFASAQATTVTLVYSGNLNGELEPCGCTVDTDFGGILRRATVVDQLRETDPKLVLISSGGLLSPELTGDSTKQEYILSGLAQLDYDAVGVQWQDLSLSSDFMLRENLPWAAFNWLTAELPTAQTFDKNGQAFFFTQWLDPSTSPYQAMEATSPINPDIEPLKTQLQAAKAKGRITLLGTTLSLEAAQQQLDLEHIDILLIESAYEHYSEPQIIGNTLVLQPGSRGQRLGVVSFKAGEQPDFSNLQHQVLELSNQVDDAERLLPWYEQYNETLRLAYEKEVAELQARESGDSPFAGADTCLACHQDQHKTWDNSKHADAFAKLEDVGKAYDPNCVGCHSVGFREAGGFLNIDVTPELANVQCESCHGAGQAHAQSAGQTATANSNWDNTQICAQCHVPDHSPRFKFEDYWPRIMH